MNPRVVLYAEGGNETGGSGPPPTPGAEMHDDALGAAHLLVRRVLAAAWGIPLAAVRFIGPLRRRGVVIRGSQLLDRETLRQALSFGSERRRPDFAVVLVDEDGDDARHRTVDGHVADLPLPRVVGCAVREFEAWLIADHAPVRAMLGPLQAPASIEQLRPTEAKALLAGWASSGNVAEIELRRTLASQCDLDDVAHRCAAFARFRNDVGRSKTTLFGGAP
jgi:hypothetical protein